MRAYLIGLHPDIWEVVCNGFEPPVDPKNPTMEEIRIIHLNGQATSVLLSVLDDDESYQMTKGARRTRKERAKSTPTTNMKLYPLTILLCL